MHQKTPGHFVIRDGSLNSSGRSLDTATRFRFFVTAAMFDRYLRERTQERNPFN